MYWLYETYKVSLHLIAHKKLKTFLIKYSTENKLIALKELKIYEDNYRNKAAHPYLIDLESRTAVDRIFAAINDIVFDEDETSFYYASEKGGILKYDFVKQVQSGSTNKSEY